MDEYEPAVRESPPPTFHKQGKEREDIHRAVRREKMTMGEGDHTDEGANRAGGLTRTKLADE